MCRIERPVALVDCDDPARTLAASDVNVATPEITTVFHIHFPSTGWGRRRSRLARVSAPAASRVEDDDIRGLG